MGAVLDLLAARFGGAAPPARQEARDLIAAVLAAPRFWPTANGARALSADEHSAIADAAERFSRGMPMAYAVRSAPFRALTLYVDERVLIPRPETELLVDLVLDATHGGSGTVIDVGTGSGCIALSLAAEGKFSRVIGTDVSEDALVVALLNGQRQAATGEPTPEFRLGSYLAPCVGDEADVIVSNPPYISHAEAAELPALVRDWEPAVALFSDDDGLSAIGAIAAQAAPILRAGGMLALEVDSRRAGRAAALVEAAGAYRDVIVRPDLAGKPRYVLARRSATRGGVNA